MGDMKEDGAILIGFDRPNTLLDAFVKAMFAWFFVNLTIGSVDGTLYVDHPVYDLIPMFILATAVVGTHVYLWYFSAARNKHITSMGGPGILMDKAIVYSSTHVRTIIYTAGAITWLVFLSLKLSHQSSLFSDIALAWFAYLPPAFYFGIYAVTDLSAYALDVARSGVAASASASGKKIKGG